MPSVEPGYLHKLLPSEMPTDSEHWKDIMEDLNKFIMPGITHWQSPNFHAYYPSQTSFPAIVGEMISAGLGKNVTQFCEKCRAKQDISLYAQVLSDSAG